ncbi:MAG: hypothetical protein CMG74_06520 [Candidatus Marinimicrobia bacterium]|nr:hypothetical protein [Candidatus Neomarinimicrobiota bacterium]|tara:strand:- start:1838 stop:2095 length:258 start_codon:yes stop_codon:yes gene_type:complete
MKKIFSSKSELVSKLTWKYLGWIGAFLVIFGYYLNANEFTSSWLVWFTGNLFVGLFSIHKKAYSTAIMSFIIMVMNIYGYLQWAA